VSHLSSTIEYYLSFNYTLAERTKFIYRQHLDRLCCSLDDPPLDQISPCRLAEFMGSLRRKNGQPYAPGYLDQIHRTLCTFFNFCVDEGLFPASPMQRLKHPKIVTGPKPRLSLAQVMRLLDAVKRTDLSERNLAIVLLMVDCGLRRSEVVALHLGHIDLEDHCMRIYEPKKNKFRDVPLSDMAHLALAAYLKKRRPPTSLNEPVFLTGRGPRRGQPISIKVIEELMKRLEKKLGFELYAHLLRHTFGNHYIRCGGLKYLQKILGHSRISTTAEFYTDPDFPDIQKEHKRAAPTAQIAKRRKTK
jgi:integrase